MTPLGISQAEAMNRAWKDEIRAGIPLPQSVFTSPFRRAVETLKISLGDVVEHVKPWYVMEDLRETIGLHTCEFFLLSLINRLF